MQGVGISGWFLVLRSVVADALDYSGGFNVPMLVGAALIGGIGSVIGRVIGAADRGQQSF